MPGWDSLAPSDRSWRRNKGCKPLYPVSRYAEEAAPRVNDPGDCHPQQLCPAGGVGHRPCRAEKRLAEGIDAFHKALPFPCCSPYDPLANCATLAAPGIQPHGQEQSTAESGSGAPHQFIEFFSTSLFMSFVLSSAIESPPDNNASQRVCPVAPPGGYYCPIFAHFGPVVPGV